MGDTRASKPLFELLDDRRESGVEESGGEGPAPAGGGRRVSVPEVAVWAALAMVLGLLVLTWAVAYNLGHSAGRTALAAEEGPRELGGLTVREPTEDRTTPTRGSAGQPVAGSSGSGSSGSGSTVRPEGRPTPSSGGGNVLTALGWSQSDPRVVDTNYLELATLSERDARDAIEFLAGEGIRTIGVRRADQRVTLYSLEVAIESGKWATMRARGEAHQREIARLGSRWQREHRGPTDFSGSYYRKFTGDEG